MKLKLSILTLTHLFVDTYATSFPAMIIFIVPKLNLSFSLLGVLISITSICGSMNQLLFGYWSDRVKKGSFIVLGTAVAAIFLSSTALAPNVFILALLLIAGGSGVSAFHPQATAAAGRLYKDRRGLGLSIFITGGNVGLSISSLIITYIASNFGLENVIFWAIPGVIVSILSYLLLYKDEELLQRPQALDFGVSRLQEFKINLKPLMILYAIVSLRAATALSITTFLPLFLKARGASDMNVGVAIFTFMISGTIGMMIGGYISDKTDRKSIILFSLIFATPALYALLMSHHDVRFFIFLFISGFILNSSLTINVAMAQELIPSSVSIASALTMGVGWGTGGILVMIFGFVADQFSIDIALKLVAAIPILTSIFAFTLPAKRGEML